LPYFADATLDDSKELRNQFNFSERAAQTSSLYPKDKMMITEPPPTLEISGTCCQFVIYDEYVKDQERIEHQDRMAKMKAAAKKVCFPMLFVSTSFAGSQLPLRSCCDTANWC
jgi:hypothetical protein